jgi:hypothetical protein
VNTMTSRIKTDAFFDFTDLQVRSSGGDQSLARKGGSQGTYIVWLLLVHGTSVVTTRALY